uniref:Uncharacterized protein n=1 Tax=Sphaerodactylus townsendi TaxID=933632 RepID=A0ACB8FZM1_9SAUR
MHKLSHDNTHAVQRHKSKEQLKIHFSIRVVGRSKCSVPGNQTVWRCNMTSEHSKAWSHVRHLHTASEGLWKDGGHSSAHKKARKGERRKETVSASSDPGGKQQYQGEDEEKEEKDLSASSGVEQRDQEEGHEGGKQEGPSTSSEPEEEQRSDQDERHEKSPSLSLLSTPSKGVKERLAQLRSQLQAQLSLQEQQEDQCPGSQLVELVERIVHGEGGDRTLSANSDVATDGKCPTCGQYNNPADYSNGLPATVEKILQRELAGLKEEVTTRIESMRREVAEKLSSLREALQAYNEHHFFQVADLSPLEELDENGPNQLKGEHHGIPQVGHPGDKISLEDKFKSQSVPTLHPLPISGRNQAMLRAAMATISAKSSFASNLSRSNSDPVEPMQPKSTIFPLVVPKLATRKAPTKMMVPPPATRTYASNGKYSNKMSTRTPALHLPRGDCEERPH